MWRKKSKELAKRSASNILKEVRQLSGRTLYSSEGLVVLADCSASMREEVGSLRKIDILRKALAQLPSEARLVAFNSVAEVVEKVPEPCGSTALHRALVLVQQLQPKRLVIISDGHPDDPQAALAEARRLNCAIDVIYCGSEGDVAAIQFMKMLVKTAPRGQLTIGNFKEVKALTETVQRAIGALPPKT